VTHLQSRGRGDALTVSQARESEPYNHSHTADRKRGWSVSHAIQAWTAAPAIQRRERSFDGLSCDTEARKRV
jgi:hypothetical protein